MDQLEIQLVHHVALNATDLEASRRFYREVLCLREIERPNFPFPGAWFQVGESQHVHLIVHEAATRRGNKGVDTRDVHFAVRVPSFRRTLEFLHAKGYREDAPDLDIMKMRVQPKATAGFPQIYILDPDRNVIEINSAVLD
jgi:catechol 2,3-dioxygenase-like lactoylglutathione lyase family enzyme